MVGRGSFAFGAYFQVPSVSFRECEICSPIFTRPHSPGDFFDGLVLVGFHIGVFFGTHQDASEACGWGGKWVPPHSQYIMYIFYLRTFVTKKCLKTQIRTGFPWVFPTPVLPIIAMNIPHSKKGPLYTAGFDINTPPPTLRDQLKHSWLENGPPPEGPNTHRKPSLYYISYTFRQLFVETWPNFFT